jgi:FixJ family two-component response regulator
MLKCIERLLRLYAHEPILFSSAQAFTRQCDVENADCVILDINLNDGSGIELRHGLKAAAVTVPVIYITGNDSPAVRKVALESGCAAFLTKPFATHELMESLKAAIGR